jgi:hypothetical protein
MVLTLRRLRPGFADPCSSDGVGTRNLAQLGVIKKPIVEMAAIHGIDS